MSFHRVSPRRCLFTEYLNHDYVNGNQDMSSFENILPFRNAKNLKPETSKYQSAGYHLDGHILVSTSSSIGDDNGPAPAPFNAATLTLYVVAAFNPFNSMVSAVVSIVFVFAGSGTKL